MQKITTHPFFSKKGRHCTKIGLDIYDFNYNMNSYNLVSECHLYEFIQDMNA